VTGLESSGRKGRTLVVGNLGRVGALDLGRDADERPAEGVLGRSVQHLVLDLCLIRGPGERGERSTLRSQDDAKQLEGTHHA